MKDRIVVLVDSELKKKVQIHGINEGLNITEITERALEEYLENHDTGK